MEGGRGGAFLCRSDRCLAHRLSLAMEEGERERERESTCVSVLTRDAPKVNTYTHTHTHMAVHRPIIFVVMFFHCQAAMAAVGSRNVASKIAWTNNFLSVSMSCPSFVDGGAVCSN